MGFITLYYARFFDEEGKHITDKWFQKWKNTLQYGDKAYNIKRDNPSYVEAKGLLINKRYYHYNIDNPDPLRIKTEVKPKINPELYNTLLQSKVAKRINEVNSNSILSQIGFKEILLIGGAIILLILFFTGGLTP